MSHRFRPIFQLTLLALATSLIPIISKPALAADVDVVWTDLVGVSATGNDLSKTAGYAWGNGGAASSEDWDGDVTLEFTTAENDKAKVVGLSDSNIDADYDTIDYAIHFRSNGNYRILENGVEKATLGAYTTTGTYSIERSGTTVKFYTNGSLDYTSLTSSTGELIADVALLNTGSTINDARFTGVAITEPDAISDLASATGDTETILIWSEPDQNGSTITGYEVQYGTVASGTFGSSYSDDASPGATITGLTNDTEYQFRVRAENSIGYSNYSNVVEDTPSDIVDVSWTDQVGVSANGNDLTKTASTAWGNGGAASTVSYTDNIALQFTATETNTGRILGFSETNADADYDTVELGIHLSSTGSWSVRESGTIVQSVGSYQANDVFKVERKGTEIKYYQNNVLVYTSGVSSTGTLLADTALYQNGGTITNAQFIEIPPADVPSAVDDLSSFDGDTEVHLYWSEPSDGGAAITGYEVEYGTVASGTFGSSYSDDAVPGATITGLTNDTAYQFRVLTENSLGLSDPSNVIQETPVTMTDVTWSSVTGANASGNDLTKTASDGWGTGGGASQNEYFGDVVFEFAAAATNKQFVCGISSVSAVAAKHYIEYGFHLKADGTVAVMEDGNAMTGYVSYSSGDLFRMVRTGTTVTFYHNGELIRTSSDPSNQGLTVYADIYSNGGTVADARISGAIGNVISSISHTANLIDPADSETSTINFTLSEAADVTIDIYEATYNAVGQYLRSHYDTLLEDDARSSGANTFVWDGEDSGSSIVPDDVYVYTITAETSAGTFVYDPTYYHGIVTFENTSFGPTNFDPHRGELATVEFDLVQPAWVTVMIGLPAAQNETISLVTLEPFDTTDNELFWDGRDKNGDVVTTGTFQAVLYSRIIPQNGIIVKSNQDITVDEVYADPIAFFPKYGEITDITYELSEAADVTLKIISPSDITVRTLIDDEAKAAGSHTVTWDGLDSSGDVPQESGIYKIEVEFTQGGTTKTRNGSVSAFY